MRRGVSVTKPIDAAKQAVAVEELAERLSGPGTRRGREVAFRCPLHDDHDPSLRVDPARGLWYCDPCAVGGDVVDLARRVLGFPDDGRGAAEAAAFLLLEFDHPIPQRPPAWFARQERQASVRDAIGQARYDLLRRRLLRAFFMPLLTRIEDVEEREAEYRILWETTEYLARMLLRDLAGTSPTGGEGRAS